MKIPLARPVFFGEELEEVKSVLESGWWTQGPKVEEFEHEFARFVGSRYAVAVSSCMAALHLALIISEERNVAVPDFTFPSVANSAWILGRNLKLLDVNVDTYNVDEVDEVGWGCVVPTHIFGNPCDMAKVKGDFIVEDAACSIGAYLKRRHVGTIGNIGCFSFHPRKLLSTGEGGMLVTNNSEIAEKARILRDHGRESKEFVLYGYNFRMSDITAAVGLIQLRHLPEILKRRREQAELYTRLISELEVEARPQQTVNGAIHNYQSYVVRLFKDSKEIIAEMARRGIETQIGTFALHLQQGHPLSLPHLSIPNSKLLYRKTLTLPLYHEMAEAEQVYVVQNLTLCVGRDKKMGD